MIYDVVRLAFYRKNSDGKVGIDGMITKDGINGMNEAADMKRIDIISPFVGALMGRVSGEANTYPITTMLTN